MLLFISSFATGRQGRLGIVTRALTIDHTQVPSDQANFPILINFTDPTFKTVANGGHIQAANAFTFSSDSAGTSLLKWEVERYNATTGEIVAWVKIANVSSASDTVFYLRYGVTITTDQSDSVNVWTNSFVAVYHLKDGTTLNLSDSFSGLTLINVNTVTATTGQIDGAAGFASASSQCLQNDSGNDPGIAFTLSAWIKATSLPNPYNTVIGLGPTTTFALFVKSNGKLACFLQATAQVSYDGTGSHTLSTATWYYVTMTYSSAAGLVGYVNGTSDGTGAANGNSVSHAQIRIGRDPVTAGRFWNGTIDEARTASVARSADWITVEYANQKPSANLVSLGAES